MDDIATICDIYDCDEATVRAWCRAGCPFELVDGKPMFSYWDIRGWLDSENLSGLYNPGVNRPNAASLASQVRRGQARSAGQQLLKAEERGELISGEPVRQWLEDRLASLRAAFAGLGDEVAPRLAGLSTPESSKLINTQVQGILAALVGEIDVIIAKEGKQS